MRSLACTASAPRLGARSQRTSSRHRYRPSLQAVHALPHSRSMKRNVRHGGARSRGGRARRGSGRRLAEPEVAESPLDAGEFLSRLKRGAFVDPPLAELRGGRPARARPAAGQAAVVLRRLEQQLAQVVGNSGSAVYYRPLVRVGPADVWRPPLALAPTRVAATPALVWGTFEAAKALLIVEIGDDGAALD